MSRITHIDIPSADNAINNLGKLVADYQQAVAQIRRIASDLHGCWGNDDMGNAFAASYVDPAADVLAGSEQSVASLREVEKYLREAVRRFQELDEGSGRYLEFQD
ncbi:hypothetical protein AB0H83_22045 [Dactylosporangium sp. NPDC050688]|uniref:hypothetical protein n=1 Tax=Dactylosporangium sp. NPDC050688 TaxID=3157217 RepID=UPI0033D51753